MTNPRNPGNEMLYAATLECVENSYELAGDILERWLDPPDRPDWSALRVELAGLRAGLASVLRHHRDERGTVLNVRLD